MSKPVALWAAYGKWFWCVDWFCRLLYVDPFLHVPRGNPQGMHMGQEGCKKRKKKKNNNNNKKTTNENHTPQHCQTGVEQQGLKI